MLATLACTNQSTRKVEPPHTPKVALDTHTHTHTHTHTQREMLVSERNRVCTKWFEILIQYLVLTFFWLNKTKQRSNKTTLSCSSSTDDSYLFSSIDAYVYIFKPVQAMSMERARASCTRSEWRLWTEGALLQFRRNYTVMRAFMKTEYT